jgi:glycolate oxidase iron-sulfur subunit
LNLHRLIKQEADQCVKCGLCLPHCPTYRLTLDEGDSPRGRISLMQALASGQLPAGGRLTFHLDRCLSCRACERACPSGVRYGPLIDASRALLLAARQDPPGERATGLQARLLSWIAAGHGRLRQAARLLYLYRASGLRWLARRSGILRGMHLDRLDALLPPQAATPRRRLGYYPPRGQERGRVALFAGCMTELFTPDTLDASIRLLTLAGYGVHIPPGQVCCGALHLHAGHLAEAGSLARRNLAAFNALRPDAVLYSASGCGATLRDYTVWPVPATGDAAGFTAPVMDVSRFLADLDWPADVSVAPLNRRVAIQDACLQRNVLRDVTPPYRLLERIPGLVIIALPGNEYCCGAAGAYMLEQPELSDQLRADKLDALQHSGAEILVSSNIGCAIHLAAGLRVAGSEAEVVHPVVLLERQIAERQPRQSSPARP